MPISPVFEPTLRPEEPKPAPPPDDPALIKLMQDIQAAQPGSAPTEAPPAPPPNPQADAAFAQFQATQANPNREAAFSQFEAQQAAAPPVAVAAPTAPMVERPMQTFDRGPPVPAVGKPGPVTSHPAGTPMTERDDRFVGGSANQRIDAYEHRAYEADQASRAASADAQKQTLDNALNEARNMESKNKEMLDLQKTQEDVRKAGINEYDRVRRDHEALANEIRNTTVDPNRFFASQSAASRFGMAMALTAGGMLQGVHGLAVNPAMKMLDDAINRDIDAQKATLNNKFTGMKGLAENSELIQRMNQAQDAAHTIKKAEFWDMASRDLQARAMRQGAMVDQKKFETIRAELDKKRDLEYANLERLRQQAALQASLKAQTKAENIRQELAKAMQFATEKLGIKDPVEARAWAAYNVLGHVPTTDSGQIILPKAQGSLDQIMKTEGGEGLTETMVKVRKSGSTLNELEHSMDVASENRPGVADLRNIVPGSNIVSDKQNKYEQANQNIETTLAGTLAGLHSEQDAKRISKAFSITPYDSPEVIANKRAALRAMMGPDAVRYGKMLNAQQAEEQVQGIGKALAARNKK